MKSKKKVKKKTPPKSKGRGISKTKTKIKWETRVMPVAKTYKIIAPLDPQDSSRKGEIRAYEDGLQVCIFEIDHQRAWDSAVFHLQALAYKEVK